VTVAIVGDPLSDAQQVGPLVVLSSAARGLAYAPFVSKRLRQGVDCLSWLRRYGNFARVARCGIEDYTGDVSDLQDMSRFLAARDRPKCFAAEVKRRAWLLGRRTENSRAGCERTNHGEHMGELRNPVLRATAGTRTSRDQRPRS
jgi:hypothetical protein